MYRYDVFDKERGERLGDKGYRLSDAARRLWDGTMCLLDAPMALSVIGDEAIRQGNNNREVRASRLLYGV
jgi:hypothetical protein